MNNPYDTNKEYLSNPSILQYVDTLQCQTQLVKITILNWQDLPLKAIEGRATGGNININNSSAIRRSGSLSLVTELKKNATSLEIMNEVTNTDTLISMNKRVSIEIGIKNSGGQYSQWDIFWFPLGIYVISNASVSYNNQGIQISLKLTDKMALLNGEAGGMITAPAIFSEDTNPVSFYDLIESLVHQIGNIVKDKIIIEDIEQQLGEMNIYSVKDGYYRINNEVLEYSTEQKDDYIFARKNTFLCKGIDFPFVYPGTLSVNAGASVASVLETIKNKLGNFEYFFDLDGAFHFREIKNYLNEGSALDNLTDAINEKYFISRDRGNVAYSFNESNLITAYTNAPQYNQIKNDYNVWGKTASTKNDLHYHLIIESLPADDELRWWTVTKKDILDENEEVISSQIIEAKCYGTKEEAISHGIMQETETLFVDADNWREKLYLDAIAKEKKDILSSELIDKLPMMMDVTKGNYTPPDLDSLTYFLDAINTNNSQLMQKVPVKQFGISNIGRRSKVISDESVNCLFPIPASEDGNGVLGETKVTQIIDLSTIFYGGIQNSAYEALRSAIHQHLSYNNNITLTTMPIYHLDVNRRIRVDNAESGIHGDYVIQSISIPLDLKGMMNITATQAIERI